MLLMKILTAVAQLQFNGTNPSGNCTSIDDGSREGYHSPLPNTYLPDCKNPLKHELWRVFMNEDGTSAGMIPRPDGLGIKHKICPNWPQDPEDDEYYDPLLELEMGRLSEEDGPLANTLLRFKASEYGLCNETVLNTSIINSMDPVYALQFANIFHRQLVFTIKENRISPWVTNSDILQVCETFDVSDNIKAHCEEIKSLCNDKGECIEMGIIPNKQSVEELVPALNEMYGVKQMGDTCNPEEWGATFECPANLISCGRPPKGCKYVNNYYVIDEVRDCCPKPCYYEDSDGNDCVRNEKDKVGDKCDPNEWGTTSCLFGRRDLECIDPPAGCKYVFDHTVLNRHLDCCAEPCYAVDGDGRACPRETQGGLWSTDSSSKVGDGCVTESFGCPSIMCGPSPEGCLSLTSLAININGNCCRSCSSVDIDGNLCNSGSNIAANSWVYFFSSLVCFVYLIW